MHLSVEEMCAFGYQLSLTVKESNIRSGQVNRIFLYVLLNKNYKY